MENSFEKKNFLKDNNDKKNNKGLNQGPGQHKQSEESMRYNEEEQTEYKW